MRTSLYARVLTGGEEVELSVSAQLRALRHFASKNGHEIVREFVDQAESGRPAFQEMIALARRAPPPFEAIIVWKLSRFSNSGEDSIIYRGLLRSSGIQVPSIGDRGYDSPTGRMMRRHRGR